jgi:rubredoxin
MYLVINKCVTVVKASNFSGHYLRNRSTLHIDVLGYIGILYHKEQPPEVWHIPPGTPCIYETMKNIMQTPYARTHFQSDLISLTPVNINCKVGYEQQL